MHETNNSLHDLQQKLISASLIQMLKRGGTKEYNQKTRLFCKFARPRCDNMINNIHIVFIQFMQEKGGGLACLLYSIVLSKGFNE